MGYYSTVDGELKASPALDEPFGPFGPNDPTTSDDMEDLIARNEGEEDDVKLVDGQITVVPGRRFTLAHCRYEDYKAESLGESVSRFVDLAVAAGSEVNGALMVYGEESGDIWRIRVDANQISTERPELLWPNGDQEPLAR